MEACARCACILVNRARGSKNSLTTWFVNVELVVARVSRRTSRSMTHGTLSHMSGAGYIYVILC